MLTAHNPLVELVSQYKSQVTEISEPTEMVDVGHICKRRLDLQIKGPRRVHSRCINCVGSADEMDSCDYSQSQIVSVSRDGKLVGFRDAKYSYSKR